MSDRGFLTRWSRRKRAAAVRERGERASQPQQEAADPITEAADPATEPAIGVSDLPPIGSIAAGADVRAFLMPGVPAAVTRAALRRAWSADPAIRDFVGLSENAWDFTTAGGVPGFGPLSLEDAKRLLDRLAGDPDCEAPPREAAGQADQQPSAPAPAIASNAEGAPDRGNTDRGNTDRGDPAATESLAAPQAQPKTRELPLARRRPRHGGALPE